MKKRISAIVNAEGVGFVTAIEFGDEATLQPGKGVAHLIGPEEWMLSIGCEKDEMSAGPEDALNFAQCSFWLTEMFQHPQANDELKSF